MASDNIPIQVLPHIRRFKRRFTLNQPPALLMRRATPVPSVRRGENPQDNGNQIDMSMVPGILSKHPDKYHDTDGPKPHLLAPASPLKWRFFK